MYLLLVAMFCLTLWLFACIVDDDDDDDDDDDELLLWYG